MSTVIEDEKQAKVLAYLGEEKPALDLFDTHAHLNDEKLFPQLSAVLDRAKANGVNHIACIGYDWPSSLLAVKIAEQYPEQVVAVIGIHPSDADTLTEEMLEKLYNLAKSSSQVKAIGEIGLDYYWEDHSHELQKKAFYAQIDLAKQLKLPISIHDRDAHGDMLEIIKETNAAENGGIMHCYSGSWEMAKVCLKLGWKLSIGGPVTFSNAKNLPEVVAKTPLEELLIETDCPYLAPHPFRGRTNEPALVRLVAEKIASIKGLGLEKTAEILTRNSKQIYGLD
ncbi:MAG: TatD family hydrolase [Peptococcaceae bacterium]|jgi:TatD DNase family protein|nr:TatD family hydrolase [Peptococcaceae bacterium]